jgi:malate/lactate dehydrogenase
VRLWSLLSEELGTDASSHEVFVIGEHGDSMLPVFSHLGQEFERERLLKVFENVKAGAADVIRLKGATTFAPALAVAEVIESIVNDRGNVLPISAYHEDLGVCIGFPANITRSGAYPVEFELNEEEREKFLKSVDIIKGEIGKLQEG